jgi:hypothetical protein
VDGTKYFSFSDKPKVVGGWNMEINIGIIWNPQWG